MKRWKAEAFGIFNHHNCCIRHVNANLNNGGCNKYAHLAVGKGFHNRFLVLSLHFAVKYSEIIALKFTVCKLLGKFFCAFYIGFVFLNRRANYVALLTTCNCIFNKFIQPFVISWINHVRANSLPARRKLVKYADIKVAVEDKPKRSRNRGGAHNDCVYVLPLLRKRCTLVYTKAVLFVGYNKRKIVKLNVILN